MPSPTSPDLSRDLSVPRFASEELERARQGLVVAVPEKRVRLSQDEEWLVVEIDGEWRQIRVHDYEAIYGIQGLYEHIVYDVFRCQSPQTIRDLLAEHIRKARRYPDTYSVLDLGAGNGCVAEELRFAGLHHFVGIDICPTAGPAATRDRPGLYDAYVTGDLLAPDAGMLDLLDSRRFDCLTCVAALGFGDIPPAVFAAAYDRIDLGGTIVFTIKSDFLSRDHDESGFARLIRRLRNDARLAIETERTYIHRVSTAGVPLEYVAFLGTKHGNTQPEDYA